MSKLDALPTPTGRELEILKVLWEKGPSSVRVVHEFLQPADDEELAYNTVQTLLRVMEAKQLVSHHVEGRTFVYTPNFSREQSTSRFLHRVFDGAASQLVLTLLRTERLSSSELDELQQMINKAREEKVSKGSCHE
ncbi:BlaI/MecI/CopY family transcriptional regulator [Telmatocola sphagniphila]|jgi:predicted transcriptional regulator|uniref:BlaI/MecI/CopY family transcriptional regulator n=1 Tax=Telmatocola sphagniphila TaxID=1123043 RepID=A0A8E6B4Z2_9BACT|nr:BlaI/MecI/CopY family transcriptional regulator [Telmatocola sphagniphila]QVL30485.1 BlaI/MecI/CopY family transcriptional regulator [Telmatocola sphagniphila]